uniref:Uncharacterized protein n=1 Tax=Daphnia galeata TaxID=27404 RepID=A0A8J2RZH5_9CRUS|nr:unnamed protein product [Daphnia galeata]
MKTLLLAAATVLLSNLVIICTSQPIEDAIASQDVALEKIADPNDDSSFADMQGSESSLKVIENKLEYWLKKYYKKTEKMNNNHGFAAFPQTGFPMIAGFPSYPLMTAGFPLMGYGSGLGGFYGFDSGLSGLGFGNGFAPGLAYGYGSLGGFAGRR